MTDEQLAAIRARVDAATPGPWMCWNGYELRVPHAEPPVVPDMAMVRIGPEPHIGTGISSVRPYGDIRALRPDAEFVAYAREDVPALLAEVERLRALACDEHVIGQAFVDRINDLEVQNVAMREIVEAVAKSNPYGSWLPATNTPPGVVCRWCMERAQTPAKCHHDHECTWRQACALLGGDTTAKGLVATPVAVCPHCHTELAMPPRYETGGQTLCGSCGEWFDYPAKV